MGNNNRITIDLEKFEGHIKNIRFIGEMIIEDSVCCPEPVKFISENPIVKEYVDMEKRAIELRKMLKTVTLLLSDRLQEIGDNHRSIDDNSATSLNYTEEEKTDNGDDKNAGVELTGDPMEAARLIDEYDKERDRLDLYDRIIGVLGYNPEIKEQAQAIDGLFSAGNFNVREKLNVGAWNKMDSDEKAAIILAIAVNFQKYAEGNDSTGTTKIFCESVVDELVITDETVYFEIYTALSENEDSFDSPQKGRNLLNEMYDNYVYIDSRDVKIVENRGRAINRLLKRAGYNTRSGVDITEGTVESVIDFAIEYEDEFGLNATDYIVDDSGNIIITNKLLNAVSIVAKRNVEAKLMDSYGEDERLDLTGETVNNTNDWLEWAAAQEGYAENKIIVEKVENGAVIREAVGDNITPFGSYTGANGNGYNEDEGPWCASFVSWCLFMSGDNTFTTDSSIAGTSNMIKYASQEKIYMDLHQTTYIPNTGDVFYRSRKNGGHVGFINECSRNSDGSYHITTIEGNSGDKVACHEYTLSSDELVLHFDGIITMNREEKLGLAEPVTTSKYEADSGDMQ